MPQIGPSIATGLGSLTNFAVDEPARLGELRARWEAWSAGMLPVPEESVQVTVDLSKMLW